MNDTESFERMENSIEGKSLIGIDVEYYSDRKHQFVCCIQISHAKKVFLVDPFYVSS